ncbi:ANM_HP_G0242860.mRNA.1.CDS.1 [Saccharomyces cerevisiae]|nr:ANM_HP_G0242860.mRNA.1.CDS.1 [Saccharomyces cerevisiae]CAI7002485.1 ANM_HP_G0242860.mRNA.1.CDS.1 [Saccharomyces cerevisiae]
MKLTIGFAVKCHRQSRTLTKYAKQPKESKGITKPGLVDVELAELNIEYIDKMTLKQIVLETEL